MIGDVIGRILFLMFLVAIPVGGIFLQIYLSKKESKWYGLILPSIPFCLSLIALLATAAFFEMGQTTASQYADGEWVTTIINDSGPRESIPGAMGGIIYTFVLLNIPTVILLAIYKAVRSKKNSHRDVEKMSVQDL